MVSIIQNISWNQRNKVYKMLWTVYCIANPFQITRYSSLTYLFLQNVDCISLRIYSFVKEVSKTQILLTHQTKYFVSKPSNWQDCIASDISEREKKAQTLWDSNLSRCPVVFHSRDLKLFLKRIRYMTTKTSSIFFV